jgi:hypothetical protein
MWPRRRSPIFTALSLTVVAVLFLVSGVAGYTLDRHARFVAGTPWSPTVIWSQVGVGAACAGAAAWFWHRGIGQLRRG